MKLLLYSGILYLIAIGAVLILQPKVMFNSDGVWKEFGIGRDPERYTWMPFWLFSIITAILAYLIILILACANLLPGVHVSTEVPMEIATPTVKSKRHRSAPPPVDMQPGYYILNTENGVPKYVFLGPEPPNLIYNNGSTAN